jgi:anti-anti-sigma factor
MGIRKITSGEVCELTVPGRIDGSLANQLEMEVLAAIRGGVNKLLINLSESDYICSAGIRVLLQYYRQMTNNKKIFGVTNPSPNIESILDLTGFKDLIVEGTRPQSQAPQLAAKEKTLC